MGESFYGDSGQSRGSAPQDASPIDYASGIPGGRIPPHNLQAERSVLGAILSKPSTVHVVHDQSIEPRDFYHQSHQRIFEVLMSLSERGEPLDLVTLTAALRDRNWYESVGGTATLTSLFEDHFSPANISHYAKIVREKALLRRMIEVTGEIQGDAFDGTTDIEAFLDESERKVFSVSDVKMNRSFASMQEILIENMHTIEDLAQRSEEITGLSVGFHDFDKLTSGLHKGQLIIVAGRPAMGKTSVVISMIQNAAVGKKAVIALFSLEMSKEELGFKLLSGLARVESKRLKIGRLADREWQRLAQACDQLQKSRIFIDDSGDLTVMDMRSRCRRLLAMEKRIDLIVVDYLQLMRGTKSSKAEASREREISEISRNLKALAKELGVPIIALSQLNRGLENRQDKRPMLSDLRESGAIEQDADMVCFVYRDEVYNKDSEEKGVAELIIAKHRAGETATVRLAWLSQYTLFANLDENSGAPSAPVNYPRPDRGDPTL